MPVQVRSSAQGTTAKTNQTASHKPGVGRGGGQVPVPGGLRGASRSIPGSIGGRKRLSAFANTDGRIEKGNFDRRGMDSVVSGVRNKQRRAAEELPDPGVSSDPGRGEEGASKSVTTNKLTSPELTFFERLFKTSDSTLWDRRDMYAIRNLYYTRAAEDFMENPPSLGILKEWIEAESFKLDCPLIWVRTGINKYISTLDRGIEQEGYKIGQRVAETMGASMAKVLKVHMDAMEANEYIWMKPRKGEDNLGDISLDTPLHIPDHKTRLAAAQSLAKILAMYAPTKSEITVDATDRFANMSNEQLQAERLKMLGVLFQMQPGAVDTTKLGKLLEKQNQKVIEGEVERVDE